MDFTCRYRVSIEKRAGHFLRVSVCAAMVPLPTAPTTKWDELRFYTYPEGWFDSVRASCVIVTHKATNVVATKGLVLKEGRFDPEFEKWAKKAAASIDYINFFWLAVEVPRQPGQKGIAVDLAVEFTKLSEEFAHVMNLDLVVPK